MYSHNYTNNTNTVLLYIIIIISNGSYSVVRTHTVQTLIILRSNSYYKGNTNSLKDNRIVVN